jgi:hypothetical protein
MAAPTRSNIDMRADQTKATNVSPFAWAFLNRRPGAGHNAVIIDAR